MEIVGARTVPEALEQASTVTVLLRSYLKEFRRRMSEEALPPYARGRQFDFSTLRQQVRLRDEPFRPDDYAALEKENERRVGYWAHDADNRLERLYSRLPGRGPDDGQSPRVQERPWEQVRLTKRRACILGDPGMGKSWLLRYEGIRAADEALAMLAAGRPPDDVPFPLFLRLDDFARYLPGSARKRRPEPLEAAGTYLLEEFEDALSIRGLKARGRFISWARAQLASKESVWLLDALDEVPVEDRSTAAFKEALECLPGAACIRGRSTDGRIYLSSRIVGYSWPFARHTAARQEWEVEVVEFVPPDVEGYVRAWFAHQPGRGAQLLGQLRSAPQILGLARIPILLSFICWLGEDASRPLPERRTELYEGVLHKLLAGEWRAATSRHEDEEAQRLRIDAKIALLLHFAWASGRDGAWRDSMASATALQTMSSTLREAPWIGDAVGHSPTVLLGELSQNDGVLARAGLPRPGLATSAMSYRWLHRTFHEYCMAAYLQEKATDAERVSLIARTWDLPEWEEMWGLYAETVDGCGDRFDELFETILENPDRELDIYLARPQRACLRLAARCRAKPHGIVFEERVLAWVDSHILPVAGAFEDPGWRDHDLLPSVHTDPELGSRSWGWHWLDDAVAMSAAVRFWRPLRERLFAKQIDCPGPYRQEAGQALAVAAVGAEEVWEGLLARLSEGDVVARALAESAVDTHRRTALLTRLTDDDRRVRATVARAIGGAVRLTGASWNETGQQLLIARLHDEDRAVRSAVVWALEPMVGLEDVRVALMAQLRDEGADVRSAVVSVLGGVVASDDVRLALIARLQDQNARVRTAAVRSLESAIENEDVRLALLARLGDDDSATRLAVTETLATVAQESDVREALLAQTEHSDRLARKAALLALRGAVEDAEVRTILLARLAHPDADVRWAAVRALEGGVGNTVVRTALLARLADKDGLVRGGAVYSLKGAVGAAEVYAALLDRLYDEDFRVQEATASVLEGAISNGAVRTALVARLEAVEGWDAEWGIIKAATIALAPVAEEPDVRDVLLTQLEHGSPSVREAAVSGLGKLVGEAAVRKNIIARSADGSFGVRSAAMRALVQATYLRKTRGLST